jgi:hypothetical protein
MASFMEEARGDELHKSSTQQQTKSTKKLEKNRQKNAHFLIDKYFFRIFISLGFILFGIVYF